MSPFDELGVLSKALKGEISFEDFLFQNWGLRVLRMLL